MSVLCKSWMNTGMPNASLERHWRRMEYFGAFGWIFPKIVGTHTNVCIFQCAQKYLEKRRNDERRTSYIHIHLVVVHGLRIRQRQFYLCWMLFDEFLFIFLLLRFGVWCRFFFCFVRASASCFVCLSPLHLIVWNVSQSHWHSDLDSCVLGAVQIQCRCRFTFDSKMWKPNKMDLISTFVRFKRIVCVPYALTLKCARLKNRFLYYVFCRENKLLEKNKWLKMNILQKKRFFFRINRSFSDMIQIFSNWWIRPFGQN